MIQSWVLKSYKFDKKFLLVTISFDIYNYNNIYLLYKILFKSTMFILHVVVFKDNNVDLNLKYQKYSSKY